MVWVFRCHSQKTELKPMVPSLCEKVKESERGRGRFREKGIIEF
uniref:Uncharacterized protein n=1 Tax=Nelumbo nucifera TaxID=4432 RepID=A0A822Z8C7_NELNU|nr:TPA_asm: hypothetical protein HUJ06_015136 [Nelumbo nucifera]